MADAPWADPTRLYHEARRSRAALDEARARCAEAIGGRPEEIIFTSGGTEANLLAVRGGVRAALAARRPARAIASAVEQTSILEALGALPDLEVARLEVDRSGRVDPDAVQAALVGGAALVSVQVGNGEIGTLQPLAEIAERVHAARAWLHADASAAAGWVPLDVAELGADLVSVSGHRAMGPKGSGFLWMRRGVRVRPEMIGDDRERGSRAGMPDLTAIIGLGATLRARQTELSRDAAAMLARTSRLREQLPKVLEEVLIHGHPTQRLPHIVSFTVPMVEGEALLLGLDAAGIAVHSGSACAATTSTPSHVLAAIGTLTHGAIRVSIGPETTDAETDRFLEALPGVVADAKARLGSRR